MAKRVINISLTQQSIQDAIDELEKFKEDTHKKIQELARRLAQEGMYIAKAKLREYPAEEFSLQDGNTGVNSGGDTMDNIISSINFKEGDVLTDGSTYYVYTDNPSAPFVEFGTGIIGKRNPHEAPTWEYDVNSHGEKGWWYVDSRDHSHWTKGMPSRPFMYETTMELSKRVAQIAREVFR